MNNGAPTIDHSRQPHDAPAGPDDAFAANALAPRDGEDPSPPTPVHEELALWISPQMREVSDIITEAALVDVAILVTGETGTGKELVARACHLLGPRRDGPFVKVNCAASGRELLESELFGHEPGAFPGADQLKIGCLETATDGTVFLDDIGALHPTLQAKLLDVLDDGQFSRLGGRVTIKTRVRVITASNQDLESAVSAATFRDDLLYRLSVVRIMVPPLRSRPEEIPGLANYFVERYSSLFGRTAFTLPPETVERLMHHRFPGNVRELENLIKRMILLRDPNLLRSPLPAPGTLSTRIRTTRERKKGVSSLKDVSRKASRAAEREAIIRALEAANWNRLSAAKSLDISYRSLFYKMKEVGLTGKPASSDRP